MNGDDTLNPALREAVSAGLLRADITLLRRLADVLWHSDELPDLYQLAPRLRPDAGYLLDRLIRFNVVTTNRRLAVLCEIEPHKGLAVANRECRDPVGVAWGASADITRRLPELVSYQTRH